MSWTDDRIDLLKQLWTEGRSASQIAAQLGGITRNAVIGKVHRLKLETRLRTVGMEADVELRAFAPQRAMLAQVVEPEPASVVSHPARRATHSIVGATALKTEPEISMADDAAPQRQSGEVVPMSRNLTLVQLSDRTCKWPLGDPLAAEFRFCGNHAGDASPYCRHHARIAFQPVSERRRVR